jgi:thiamine biosynthesis lipoprotein
MRAELADALATAIFVLGKDKGLALIDSLNGIECIIIDDDGNIWYSKNISPQEN